MDQKTVIKQQISPESNGTRASNMFPMSGDDKFGQKVNPTNIPLPQE